MVKARSNFVCQQCGFSQVGWAGKCPNCNAWGTMVETFLESGSSKGTQQKSLSEPIILTSIPTSKTKRVSTKITELDRVLGGGLIGGQVILLAGEPGIGKSTILLQLSEKLGKTLYVSGEESGRQIKLRAIRLGVKKKTIQILEETDIDQITTLITNQRQKLELVVIDSIQTMVTSDLSGMAGSIGQVRECTYRLVRLGKRLGVPIVIVGHVTKEGTVAGPAVLAHLVDTVLWFEGDKTLVYRLLRAVKNRFGPTDEVGIFSMQDQGLISMINANDLFLSKTRKSISGSCIASIMEGTRPILVEIQSLVVPTKQAFPKRIAQGIDKRRLELLIAVLTRRCGLPLFDYDCFVNLVGGINIGREPSADLAICLSLASAYFNKPVLSKVIAIGEVGLLGEIREVAVQDKRIKEAKRLGFSLPISSKNANYLGQVIKKSFK
jgi:DNA repair protein RadA/Sms